MEWDDGTTDDDELKREFLYLLHSRCDSREIIHI